MSKKGKEERKKGLVPLFLLFFINMLFLRALSYSTCLSIFDLKNQKCSIWHSLPDGSRQDFAETRQDSSFLFETRNKFKTKRHKRCIRDKSRIWLLKNFQIENISRLKYSRQDKTPFLVLSWPRNQDKKFLDPSLFFVLQGVLTQTRTFQRCFV